MKALQHFLKSWAETSVKFQVEWRRKLLLPERNSFGYFSVNVSLMITVTQKKGLEF